MNSLTLILPPPNSKLHAHNKGHWRSKSGACRALRKQAFLLCKTQLHNEPPEWNLAGVEYRFFFADNRRRDTANAIQSMKPAIDGVVDAGLIKDDSWQHLQLLGASCAVDRDNSRTEILFRLLD